MQLKAGDVAVVTGAASGIGLALATALADRGLSLVLADVEDGPLHQVSETLGDRTRLIAVQTDVRRAGDLEALADRTIAAFGRVDLIANIAGVAGPWAPVWQQTLEDWRWLIEVNLFGVIHGIRAFVPHLVAQGVRDRRRIGAAAG
jgi:NADP-dependent 3-hydroxy acid dehydrogenase YdfG